ncbi:MAG: methyltransferase [Clostridia bacterium]|nr:methyltransferase [Clostridia bacterium]
MVIKEDETLEDLMIDGLKIIQSKNLYRFSSDAVILSRFAPKVGGRVADFCSGSGIVGIHYYALNKSSAVDCFELQAELADLCARSVEYDGLSDKIRTFNLAIQDIPDEFNGVYSLILCNPPYKKKNTGEKNPEDHIAICRHEIAVTLDEITAIAAKKLCRGGRLCICQKVERFLEVIASMQAHGLNPCRIQFVTAGRDKAPYLVLVEGAKGVAPQLKVMKNYENTVANI